MSASLLVAIIHVTSSELLFFLVSMRLLLLAVGVATKSHDSAQESTQTSTK